MTAETIERLLAELKESYFGTATARDGGVMLVRLPDVQLPADCRPPSTAAVVALDPNKPKPDFYLKAIPSVRGAQPQHGTAILGGESWCTFSYNLRWDEGHTAIQFVEGMLQRFA